MTVPPGPRGPRGRHTVVVVGGGIAGLEALMALADLGEGRLDLHVVADHPSFVLAPQLLGEPWGGSPLHIDLAVIVVGRKGQGAPADVTLGSGSASLVHAADRPLLVCGD